VLSISAYILFTPFASALTAVSQSYKVDKKLPVGSLVSLKINSADEVEATSLENVESLFGVVITADSSMLSLTREDTNQAMVTTNGIANVLVSNANGPIKKGDHVTASPIAGVGMRANANIRIIGIAQADLKESDQNKQTYKDKEGVEHTVTLGQIPILVNVSYFFKEPEKTIIPSAIQNVANALAGRQVSTLPILISAAIFIVTIIVVTVIIYSMIRNSIISVGRNPMSQAAVYRDLIHMIALVLAILAVAVIAIYLILTRL
jgi:hypothetical protein